MGQAHGEEAVMEMHAVSLVYLFTGQAAANNGHNCVSNRNP